jgi:hypothetical protein
VSQGARGPCCSAASALCALVGRSLAEVRLTQAVQNLEHLLVSEFVGELAPAATLEANARASDSP